MLFLGAAAYTALRPDGLAQGNATHVAANARPDYAGQDKAAQVPKTARESGAHDLRSGGALTAKRMEDGSTVTTFRPGARPGSGPVVIDGTARGQDLRVAHLPQPGLVEETPFGDLPRVGPSGERAMDVYARAWSGTRGARIAIVVGGLGLSQTGTQYAIEQLPEEVTLAFAASGNSLDRWMQAARRDGHEILLQIPLEPYNYPQVDPGMYTLTVDAGEGETMDDLHRAMGRITNYTGIMNYLGGRFMAERQSLEPVMREIAARGLMFLDDGTSTGSEAERLAQLTGTPFAVADITIDATRERGAILKRLDALERAARRNGSAIGVASAFEESVDAIAAWMDEAAARNVEIVGVSALAEE